MREPLGALGAEPAPDPRRTLDALATLLIVVLTIAILYLAREILVPIAIAVLLSFAMAPLVKLLRRTGLGKRVSVGLVVLATFLIAVGLGLSLARQVTDLAAQAPRLQGTVMRKVDGVRAFVTDNAVLAKMNATIAAFQPAAKQPATKRPTVVQPAGKDAGPASPLEAETGAGRPPTPVEVVAPTPGPLVMLQTAIGFAASPLATTAFVAIYIVFILLQREDLRNRLIRLAGSGDLQRTTLALNDAARRLSRYLLAQLLLNTGFGAVVGVGLTVIGVPSPLLWGIVAIFMRFIPYIGIIGAAAEPGWSMFLETAMFFAVIEFVTGQMIEPLVFGRNTGISPIAVVVSATFWTWLWGPVGLVVSTPLTVCLVVMGRHVSRLAFLDVLLGDAPALTEVELFYQRMLAGDPSEILDHADDFLKDHTLLDYCDAVAMRALLMAQGDVRRGALDEVRQGRIRDTMRVLARDLADRDDAVPPSTQAEEPDAARPVPSPPALDEAWAAEGAVLCFAGRSVLDEAAGHLLGDVLHEHGIDVRVEPAEALLRGLPAGHDASRTRLVVLSFLDADLGVAQAKVATRRLRRRVPGVPLIAAFWMTEDEGRLAGLAAAVRCDACVPDLPGAVHACLERAATPAISAKEAAVAG